MKQIIAIIPPHRLESVENALHEASHLPGFTWFRVHGHPRGTGPHHAFTGAEWNPDEHNQVAVMMFCADEDSDIIINALRLSAYTGNRHDGLIAVVNVESILRIRTGERGDAAV
ncbi:P-II family nitrogen regulator [Cupriavidus alkaliphilus]|uniref:P-II family nitrogen regulator n=1 Tax=Cupriavidus alkaliphilus TaxID=942866 RepID=UPI00339D88FC